MHRRLVWVSMARVIMVIEDLRRRLGSGRGGRFRCSAYENNIDISRYVTSKNHVFFYYKFIFYLL